MHTPLTAYRRARGALVVIANQEDGCFCGTYPFVDGEACNTCFARQMLEILPKLAEFEAEPPLLDVEPTAEGERSAAWDTGQQRGRKGRRDG